MVEGSAPDADSGWSSGWGARLSTTGTRGTGAAVSDAVSDAVVCTPVSSSSGPAASCDATIVSWSSWLAAVGVVSTGSKAALAVDR